MTVTEIAKRAGVSIGTVDRVLHNRGRVSDETREKIQNIINDSGYQPNPLARHLKKNLKYKIGVFIPKLSKESNYWKLIYDGIEAAVQQLSAFSFELELFDFERPDRRSFYAGFQRMEEAHCDAWIIAPVMQEDTLFLLMNLKKDIPYAFIDCPLPGASPLSTVFQDPFKGGFLAGRLMNLISSSNGPFVVIRPFNEAHNLNERARGFKSWFSSRPYIIVTEFVCQENEPHAMRNALDKLITDVPNLRGIFTVSSMANIVSDFLYKKCLRGSGLAEDIKIIGYDLVPANQKLLEENKIDCLISQRPEEQGRLVMDQIYRRLVLEETTRQDIFIPLDIFFRENL